MTSGSDRWASHEPVRHAGHVLVGIDGSDGSVHAVAWAADEARRRGAELVVAFVWHVPLISGGGAYFDPPEPELQDLGRDILQETINRAGLEVAPTTKLTVRCGHPSRELRRLASQPGVELTVVGKRGWGPVMGMLLGSVSHALAHEPPAPLVIVPPHPENGNGGYETRSDHVGPRRIVVGVDGSDHSLAAVRWARQEAVLRHATAEAVLAWMNPVPHRAGAVVAGPREILAIETAALDALDRVVDEAGRDGVVERRLVRGRAAPTLVERAGGADMLVVGTRGLGAAGELPIGSTSQACVHRATVPVVIVPCGWEKGSEREAEPTLSRRS